MLLLQFAFIYTTGYVGLNPTHNLVMKPRGADHQQALYGALAELARQPEYIQPLREEVEAVLAEYGATVPACDRMILLDSFLKECQRLHPPAASMST